MKRYYVIILFLWLAAWSLNGYMDRLDFYDGIPQPCGLLWFIKDIWHLVKLLFMLCLVPVFLLAMFPSIELSMSTRPTKQKILLTLAAMAILAYVGHELFMKWIFFR